MQQANYIVLQCYGDEAIFYECAFALLSISRWHTAGLPAEVWIYTDKPEWFSRFTDCPFQLNFRKLDNNTIRQWRGSIDFVHRVKICLLQDFVQHRTGNILYLDTDVVLQQPLDPLFAKLQSGQLFMHVMEGKVAEGPTPVIKKLNRFFQKNRSIQIAGSPAGTYAMWNAGVLGFNTQHSQLLNDVLKFTDDVYPLFPRHIIEQFAFSAIFASHADVKAASPYLLHYWNLKELRPVLGSFLMFFRSATWPQLVDYSTLLQVPVFTQEKANYYHNRSIAGKIAKKRWEPAMPDWSLLLQQL